jgi:hypothetical protein
VAKKGAAIGVAGNRTSSGIDTGEYLRTLAGASGRTIFDQMRRSDPSIKSALQAIELPIRKAKYTVAAASDKAQDKEIAEIIEANLLRGMSITWDDTLRHALLSHPFGFSILEKVWELKDGKAYLAKLDPRLPQSMTDSSQWGWDKKTGELLTIKQRAQNGQTYDLPIEKLLVFTCEKEGDNWEGVSVLRPCYKPWKIKDDLEKINVINHDRHGVGIPVATMPEGVKADSSAWAESEKALEDLCANEKSHLLMPFGTSVTLLGGANTTPDTLASIKFYDELIPKVVFAQFINLGTTQTGSRSLGDSFIDFFLMSLQARAEYICEVINRFLIREYVDYNWEVKEYPVFQVGLIRELDPFTLSELVKAGVMSKDLETENMLRRNMRLPEIEKQEQPKPAIVPVKPEGKGDDQIDEQDANDDEGDGKDAEDLAASEKKNAHKDWHKTFKIKKLSEKEVEFATAAADFPFCDIEGMEMRLNTAVNDYSREILQISEYQRAAIIDQLVKGVVINRINVPRKAEMFDVIMEAYREQARKGAKDVIAELRAQGVMMADPLPKQDLNLEKFYTEYARIEVEGAADKLVSVLAKKRVEALKMRKGDDELRKDLEDTTISDSNYTNIVDGAVNQGWGDGRNTTGEQFKDEIDRCIYTSVMDTGTCEACLASDGAEHELGDPQYMTPNPECAGMKRCRCMTVFVMKAEALPEAEYQRRKVGQ